MRVITGALCYKWLSWHWLVSISAGGSKNDSLLAILIVSREASVPSTWREGRKKIFLRLHLNVVK